MFHFYFVRLSTIVDENETVHTLTLSDIDFRCAVTSFKIDFALKFPNADTWKSSHSRISATTL